LPVSEQEQPDNLKKRGRHKKWYSVKDLVKDISEITEFEF